MGPLGTIDYDSLEPSEGEPTKNKKIKEIEKNKVTITKSGDYWNDNKNLKISINADPNFYDINTKNLDGFAEISNKPMYSFGDEVEDDGNEKDETNNDKPKDDKNKLSTGAIVGIVVGCFAFVAIVIVVIVVVVHKKKVVGATSN